MLDAYMVSVTNLFEQIAREIREGIIDSDAFENFGGNGLISSNYYSGAFGKKFKDELEKAFDLDSSIRADV